MPLYEYACRDCGNNFELRLRYDERLNAQVCPECEGNHTMLRLSVPAAVGARASEAPADTGGFCQGGGGFCGCGGAFDN